MTVEYDSKRSLDNLSSTSKSLWAKVSETSGNLSWMPLVIHMSNSCGVMERIWDSWLSNSVKNEIISGITAIDYKKDISGLAKNIALFLAAAHDIGKAIPAFQCRKIIRNTATEKENINRIIKAGLPFKVNLNIPDSIHHALASELILDRNEFDGTMSVVLGGHHGRPQSNRDLHNSDCYPDHTGFLDDKWLYVQDELLEYAVNLSNSDIDILKQVKLSIQSQVLLTAIVIISDWIASNEDLFPYENSFEEIVEDLDYRVQRAWNNLHLPHTWDVSEEWKDHNLYERRFGYTPRPFQSVVSEVAKNTPDLGLMIIEASMGEGKTESALVASEIIAQRFGQSGIIFSLPTQATADGIFLRIISWIRSSTIGYKENSSIFLAHGKSKYNKNYKAIADSKWNLGSEKDNIIVHEWFNGRKKGLLSDFVIGTVDQVLMAGLKQRHVALRHLGLASKVVIIDECHAYDAYMGSYLCKVLQWLGSYNVPVLLLSATLPPSQRIMLVNSYINQKEDLTEGLCMQSNLNYPLITYTSGNKIMQESSKSSSRHLDIHIKTIKDEELFSILDEKTSCGGYIGIIVNTVNRAQTIAKTLKKRYPDEVSLLHSGFTSLDRTIRESTVLDSLKKENRKPAPYRTFIVGTQVIEQSLDLDFDLLVTDICPMDLLIQRIGRLHRHDNPRPSLLKDAYCYVLDTGEDFEKGSELIYGKYHLINTRYLLPEVMRLPEDIPNLVQTAYDSEGISVPDNLLDEYKIAKNEMDAKLKDKNERAKIFQMKEPSRMQTLVGWLDQDKKNDPNDKKAQAAVRDTNDSIDVILVHRVGCSLQILPWIEEYGGVELPPGSIPDDLAFVLAGCKLSLPYSFSTPYNIDKTLSELQTKNCQDIPKEWMDSKWLKGELFLTLDDVSEECMSTFLMTKEIVYEKSYGLSVKANE